MSAISVEMLNRLTKKPRTSFSSLASRWASISQAACNCSDHNPRVVIPERCFCNCGVILGDLRLNGAVSCADENALCARGNGFVFGKGDTQPVIDIANGIYAVMAARDLGGDGRYFVAFAALYVLRKWADLFLLALCGG